MKRMRTALEDQERDVERLRRGAAKLSATVDTEKAEVERLHAALRTTAGEVTASSRVTVTL